MFHFTIDSPYKEDKSRNINRYDSFHRALAPILIFVQSGGFMPFSGVTSTDLNEVAFKRKSLRFVYSVFTMGSMVFESLSSLFTMGKVKLSNIDIVFYRLSSMYATYQFLMFARRWPDFIRSWTAKEQVFLGKMYKIPGLKLRTKLIIIACVVFVPALIEHFLFLVSLGYELHHKIHVCNVTVNNIVEFYYRNTRQHVFAVIPYFSNYSVIWLAWINIAITIIWNFADVFIALLGVTISHRMIQINHSVKLATQRKGKNLTPDLYWFQIRTHFLRITDMLESADREISSIAISALGCDMYFICNQFYQLSIDRPYAINYIYFWFSIMFFILRTFVAVFCASMIHASAQGSMMYLKSVPTIEWTLDVRRYFDHMRWDVIAFSGKKFFLLTRGAILTMAGYIFTYELLLANEAEPIDEKAYCKNIY